jgi:hypothetical protein
VLILILAEAGPLAAEEPPRPNFVLRLADGTEAIGPVEQIANNWSVQLGGDKPVTATGLEAVSLRRDKTQLPALPRPEQVILVNGDRIPGRVQELTNDRIHVQADLGKGTDFVVPVSAVAIIWIAAPDGVDNPSKWRRQLAVGQRSRDAVYLQNGEVIEGILNSIKGQNLQIESSKKNMTVPFSKVAVIAFNTGLVRQSQSKGVHARLVLDTGCRLTIVSAQADGSLLTGKTDFGTDVAIPLNRILAIDWLGGSVIYLSDRKPRNYQFRSFLPAVRWPYAKDASVMESDLRLGGRFYDKGLGVHTASQLTYDIGPNDCWFEALVGLDDTVGKEGSARIQVLLDGKPQKLTWDGNLTWQTGPRTIRLAVAGAKELTLVSDFGSYGDVQGCVDWANARLIKNR